MLRHALGPASLVIFAMQCTMQYKKTIIIYCINKLTHIEQNVDIFCMLKVRLLWYLCYIS